MFLRKVGEIPAPRTHNEALLSVIIQQMGNKREEARIPKDGGIQVFASSPEAYFFYGLSIGAAVAGTFASSVRLGQRWVGWRAHCCPSLFPTLFSLCHIPTRISQRRRQLSVMCHGLNTGSRVQYPPCWCFAASGGAGWVCGIRDALVCRPEPWSH